MRSSNPYQASLYYSIETYSIRNPTSSLHQAPTRPKLCLVDLLEAATAIRLQKSLKDLGVQVASGFTLLKYRDLAPGLLQCPNQAPEELTRPYQSLIGRLPAKRNEGSVAFPFKGSYFHLSARPQIRLCSRTLQRSDPTAN